MVISFYFEDIHHPSSLSMSVGQLGDASVATWESISDNFGLYFIRERNFLTQRFIHFYSSIISQT